VVSSNRKLFNDPIQYEHAPLPVRCAMLRKHAPVDPVLSCLSCFRKPSVGVCQVVSNSPDPGIAWPSARFPPDLWRWFEEDTVFNDGRLKLNRDFICQSLVCEYSYVFNYVHIFTGKSRELSARGRHSASRRSVYWPGRASFRLHRIRKQWDSFLPISFSL